MIEQRQIVEFQRQHLKRTISSLEYRLFRVCNAKIKERKFKFAVTQLN